ncbi:UNVERIFIED_CONTAM: hypothetical protein Slati_2092300 [Sesamum latifolium]|uniref:Uncharacterized protein n=1 Tax=Sesamum latifolium TaxID=2727402 RepID=A0AAW2WUP8_9LAMI
MRSRPLEGPTSLEACMGGRGRATLEEPTVGRGAIGLFTRRGKVIKDPEVNAELEKEEEDMSTLGRSRSDPEAGRLELAENGRQEKFE